MDLQERGWGKKPDGGYGLKMGKGGVGGGGQTLRTPRPFNKSQNWIYLWINNLKC